MPTLAPETPTTANLERMYGPGSEVTAIVAEQRQRASDIIVTGRGWVSGLGACAMTEQTDIILREAEATRDANDPDSGLLIVARENDFKPRSAKPGVDPESQWWGLWTENPKLAYKTLVDVARIGCGAVAEVSYFEPKRHMERNGRLWVYAWGGGRTTDLSEDQANAYYDVLARYDPMLPIGVKNGLSGDVDSALRQVDRINILRQKEYGEGAAPAFLIYRGGLNAQNPTDWGKQYIKALNLSGGRMVTDTAHGTECAHHPDGKNEKSVDGQIIASDHLLELTESGYAGVGSISEASDAKSDMDPPIPHALALGYARRLHAAKMATLVSVR